MMGVGAKRALGLYRSCAPRHRTVSLWTREDRRPPSTTALLFRFKDEGGAILGLLWNRENGQWRIVAYRSFEQ